MISHKLCRPSQFWHISLHNTKKATLINITASLIRAVLDYYEAVRNGNHFPKFKFWLESSNYVLLATRTVRVCLVATAHLIHFAENLCKASKTGNTRASFRGCLVKRVLSSAFISTRGLSFSSSSSSRKSLFQHKNKTLPHTLCCTQRIFKRHVPRCKI